MNTLMNKNTAQNLEMFMQYGTRMFLKKKAFIFEKDKIGDGFYFVYRGLVKIITKTFSGEERIISLVGPENIFGEQALDNVPYFSSSVAVTDCVIYYFSCNMFKDLISEYPELLDLFSMSISDKMNVLITNIHSNTLSSQQHMASALLRITEINKCNEIPLTQTELAQFTGFSRITVYKILKQWQEEGLIEIRKGKCKYHLLNSQELINLR